MWPRGTLLGLQDTTKPYGRFPGASVFIMLRLDPITSQPVVLTPDGQRALIPHYYLVPVEPPSPPAGG